MLPLLTCCTVYFVDRRSGLPGVGAVAISDAPPFLQNQLLDSKDFAYFYSEVPLSSSFIKFLKICPKSIPASDSSYQKGNPAGDDKCCHYLGILAVDTPPGLESYPCLSNIRVSKNCAIAVGGRR